MAVAAPPPLLMPTPLGPPHCPGPLSPTPLHAHRHPRFLRPRSTRASPWARKSRVPELRGAGCKGNPSSGLNAARWEPGAPAGGEVRDSLIIGPTCGSLPGRPAAALYPEMCEQPTGAAAACRRLSPPPGRSPGLAEPAPHALIRYGACQQIKRGQRPRGARGGGGVSFFLRTTPTVLECY